MLCVIKGALTCYLYVSQKGMITNAAEALDESVRARLLWWVVQRI